MFKPERKLFETEKASKILHVNKFGIILTLFDMCFFNREPPSSPNHDFVVIAPMIMKFGTGIKLDVFYTVVTK